MKKAILSIMAIATLAGCKKKDSNNTNPTAVTRSFSGTAFGKIDVAVVTTEGTTDQNSEVKVSYAAGNPVPSTYRDTVKVVFSGGIQIKSVDNSTEGAVNTLTFSGLPKSQSYTCMFIRSGIAPYPDTLIKVSCN